MNVSAAGFYITVPIKKSGHEQFIDYLRVFRNLEWRMIY